MILSIFQVFFFQTHQKWMYALARAQDLFVDYLFEGFLLIILRRPCNFWSLLKSRHLYPLLGNDFLFVYYGFKPKLILIKLFLYNQISMRNKSCTISWNIKTVNLLKFSFKFICYQSVINRENSCACTFKKLYMTCFNELFLW
jgi:hypothetical protein